MTSTCARTRARTPQPSRAPVPFERLHAAEATPRTSLRARSERRPAFDSAEAAVPPPRYVRREADQPGAAA
eukprot:4250168-Pleurochrysis_carterae.AAC.1